MPATSKRTKKHQEEPKKQSQLKLAVSAQPEDLEQIEAVIDWLRAHGKKSVNKSSAIMAALRCAPLGPELLKAFEEREKLDRRKNSDRKL